MRSANMLELYVHPLLAGQRVECRSIVQHLIGTTNDVESIYHEVLWPAMERVERLYRADRINSAVEHMATRINRQMADQIAAALPKGKSTGRRVLITCADGEPEELGGQMCADLFEVRGWEVYFLGGGVPNDEILNLVGQLRPDILLIFGTQPTGVPGVRRLVDLIRSINAHPTMNIMVSGGVFNRADGLWREVNADLTARSAGEALDIADQASPRQATAPIEGPVKKRRRRRRPAVATAEV